MPAINVRGMKMVAMMVNTFITSFMRLLTVDRYKSDIHENTKKDNLNFVFLKFDVFVIEKNFSQNSIGPLQEGKVVII